MFEGHSDVTMFTRAVLVFATERKNNVDPRLQSQNKVNYAQLLFALIILEFSHLDDIIVFVPDPAGANAENPK